MFSHNLYKYGATVKELKSNKSPLMKLLKRFPGGAWNYTELSANPNITWEYIQNNPNLDWSINWLSANPSVTREMILSDPEKWGKCQYLAENPNITVNDLKEFFSKHDFPRLSINPNITWKIIQDTPDYDWNICLLSRNPGLSLAYVPNDIWLEKCLPYFLHNINTTWELFLSLRNKCSKSAGIYLSENPNVTWEIVQNNPDINWSWPGLASENPNITWDVIKNNLNKPIFPEWASCNPNLTYRFARRIARREFETQTLSFHDLSKNKFLHDPGMFNRVTRNRALMRRYAVENM